jgi:hypothetical protein
MPRKTPVRLPPRFRKGAELIVKANCDLDVRGQESDLGVYCGVFILGNREGFRWLSKYFAWRAGQIDEDAPFCAGDPDDHDHLVCHGPMNKGLSDDIDVMFGSFAQRHRRQVLKACGLTRARRLSGHLVSLFRCTLQYLMTLSKDQRTRGHPAWPRAISVLRQLIREGQETVAALEAVTKRVVRPVPSAPPAARHHTGKRSKP